MILARTTARPSAPKIPERLLVRRHVSNDAIRLRCSTDIDTILLVNRYKENHVQFNCTMWLEVWKMD